jgi:hypothetical protein
MSQLKLTIVGDPTPLRNATRVAEKSLRSLLTNANKTSAGINKAFGAVGLGIGFATLTNGLKQATKAASDDRKSQGLLAGALQNTLGATDAAIAGAERYIKRTQTTTAVLDDELRPALATAVRATGSLTGGQALLDAALDISADKGLALGSVTNALAKAYTGNTGAIKKLVPGLKLTGNLIADVEAGFGGAAEKAANLDPYNRLQVIFADIQETIGAELLPALEEFSAYIVSPEGQKNLKQVVELFVTIGRSVADVSKFLLANIVLVKAVVAAVITAKVSWIVLGGAVKLYTALTGNAVVATKLLKGALISTGIGAIAVLVGSLAEAWINASDAQEDYVDGQPDGGLYIPTENPFQTELDNNIQAAKDKATKAADDLQKALKDKIAGIKRTAETFRDAIGLAFGTFGKDENSVFNVDVVINKLKRLVDAAKGFAQNIARLRKAGADESVISEIVGMGPAQGNIVAKGLLGSGKLQEYLNLRGSLYQTGAEVGSQASMAGDATYNIKLEGTSVKASDIIREIQILEKKTGRKYLVNG